MADEPTINAQLTQDTPLHSTEGDVASQAPQTYAPLGEKGENTKKTLKLKEVESKVFVDIKELREWDKNPRSIKKNDFERLKKQITELGQYKPIIVTPDGEVLGGNMRIKAYRELGMQDIWVSIVNPKNEDEKLKFALSDNDRAGFYDEDLIANLLPEYPEFDWSEFSVDLRAPRSLNDIIQNLIGTQQDEAPELTDTPAISVLGEVYKLGRHKLMCGDAIKSEDVKKLLNNVKADMVFTDPPYNVDYQGSMDTFGNKNRKEGIMNDVMSKADFHTFLLGACKNMIENTNGPIYICMSSSELDSLKSAFEESGGHWQSFIIWVKNTFTLSRNDYQNQYEPILYGWPNGVQNHFFVDDRTQGNVMYDINTFYNEKDNTTTVQVGNQKVIIKGRAEGHVEKVKKRTDIWEYPKPTVSKEHPTMKPIALVANSIRNSTISGNIVLDLFGGSGSTLIAAEQTNRTCYMSELDPKYVDVIRKRYWKFVNGGKEEGWEQNTPVIK
jgi:DNA modification methylase